MPAFVPHIRPFAQGDQDAARGLVLAGLGEHFGFIDASYNPDLDDIQANYVAVGHVFIVAEKDGELVGTAGLIVGGDGVGQMVRVSVARAYRRAGIGHALVSHLLEVARERGLNRVWMETNADWVDALGLYQRCGFAECERHDGLVFLALDLRYWQSVRQWQGANGEDGMQIRELTEDDAAIYWPVRLRALREEPEAFGSSYEESVLRPVTHIEERFRAARTSGSGFTLGAFDGDALVGTVTLGREEGRKNRHIAGVYGVYVAPEARGRGIGRALMEALIDRAHAMPGLEQLRLAVVSTGTAARALYLAVGFTTYALEPRSLKLDDRYLDEELMVLWLAPAAMPS